MKLGNISHTIVQVPKFFYDTTKDVDAFKLHYKHLIRRKILKRNNFTPRNILTSNLDINLNLNPRLKNNLFDEISKEIYLPIYQKKFYSPICDNDNKDRYRYKPRYDHTKNYLKYKKISDINETLSPHLKQEIMNNTSNLIERINSDYDLTLYSNFNTRSTMNNFLSKRFSIINSENNKTDKEIFRKILTLKINNLRTINPKVKDVIKKLNHKKNIFTKKQELKKSPEIMRHKLTNILKKCNTNYTNFLSLKNNNQEKNFYSTKDTNFIEENKMLTERINNNRNSLFYNEFPSKTRMEFSTLRKKINIAKHILRKLKKKDSFNYHKKEFKIYD